MNAFTATLASVKGWRTVFFGGVVAVAPALLTYLGGVDWTALGVSPAMGAVIGAGIIGLRAITTGPIGGSK
jgi:hypothetical protein